MPPYSILPPEALFPSDNDFGIPTLIDLQPLFLEAPVHIWGQTSRRSRTTRTWLFYVDDYKFEALWKSPSSVTRTAATTAGEPNFSLSPESPVALAIWQTYRKRWLARFWQSMDTAILVDLNVPREYDLINLLGVPDGWNSYCTRAADFEVDRLREQGDLAEEKAGRGDFLLVVYAGGRKVRELCERRGWVWIGDSMNELRRSGDRDKREAE